MRRLLHAPSRRSWAIATAVAGGATLAFTAAIALAMRAPGGCVAADSLVRFELARSLAELQQVLHAPTDPCRAPASAAMDRANLLDLLGFIPGYALLTAAAAVWLGPSKRMHALLAAAIAASAAAAVADCAETLGLLAITKDVEAHAWLARITGLCAVAKFLALGAQAALLALLCLRSEPRRWRLGVLLLTPALCLALPVAPADRYSAVTLACLAGWAGLAILAVRTWRRPSPDPPCA